MYLEIESRTENFIEFSLEFLGFFGAFGYFSRFFFNFLVIVQTYPESVNRWESVDQILRAKHRVLCSNQFLNASFCPKTHSRYPFASIWVFLSILHLQITSKSSISLPHVSQPAISHLFYSFLKSPKSISKP